MGTAGRGTAVAGVTVLALLACPFLLAAGYLHWGPSGWAFLVPRTVRRQYRWAQLRGGFLRRPRSRGRQGTGQFPRAMREIIFAADRQRCLRCGARRSRGAVLNADHGVPWIQGGLTCPANGFTLCGPCNQVKRAYYQDTDGKVWGRLAGRRLHEAERIRGAELAARLSPLRAARLLAACSRAARATSRRSPGRRSRRASPASRAPGRARRAPSARSPAHARPRRGR